MLAVISDPVFTLLTVAVIAVVFVIVFWHSHRDGGDDFPNT